MTTLLRQFTLASALLAVATTGLSAELPVVTDPPAEVCSGISFVGADGKVATGTKACDPPGGIPPLCTADGQVNCLTDAAHPAVNVAGLAAKVGAGSSLGGVPGTATPRPEDCAVDGDTLCVSHSDFRAAEIAGLADKVLSTTTVAGINGSIVLPAAGQVAQGTNFGANSSLTGTLTVPAPANVKAGFGAYGPNGSLTPTLADCAADEGIGCVATATFASAEIGTFSASDIRLGVTIAGITGNQAGMPPSCATETETGCLSNSAYRATNLTGLAAKVLQGQSVAGVGGSNVLPAASTVLSSVSFGLGGTGTTGTLTLPPTSNVLAGTSAYGVGGTGSTPAYAPDFPAVANVLGPNTVNGVPGTLTLPAAANVLSGSGAYGAGGNSHTPSYVPDYPSVGNVLAPDTVNGVPGTLTLPNPANVRVGAGAFGVGGTGSTPTLADCSSDGEATCVAIAAFPAAKIGAPNLVAANVKNGVQIGGVTGTYPSASAPLQSATGTTDLTNFVSQLKANGSFEFFDSTGARYTGSGDSDIVASNVKTTVPFENLSVTGSFVGGLAGGDAPNIRVGVTLGGIAGTLKTNCRNAVRNAIYNQDGLPNNGGGTSGTQLDPWDTIDDYGNATAPTGMPWGANNYCDGSQITNVTTSLSLITVTAATHGGDVDWTKIFLDSYTGLYITNVLDRSATWSAGIALCDNLNNGNQGGAAAGNTWRMPTQKELIQLFNNGLYYLNASFGNFLDDAFIWSASTTSYSTANAFGLQLNSQTRYQNYAKTGSYQVFCVR